MSDSSSEDRAQNRKKIKKAAPRKRRTPCEFCRTRQRACDYNEPCGRCVHAKIECVFVKNHLSTTSPSSDDEDNGDALINMIEEDLIGLERAYSSFSELKQQLENELSRSKQNYHTEFHIDNRQTSEWKLVLRKNGHIRIYANISSFEGLLKFAQSGLQQTSALTDFTPPSHPLNPRADLYHAKMQLAKYSSLAKLLTNKWHKRRAEEAANNEDHISGVLSAFALKGEDSDLKIFAPVNTIQGLMTIATRKAVVSHLLAIFWQCIIPHVPILHEETIKSRFYNRQHPISNPLICAILAMGTAWDCRHIFPESNFPSLSRNRDLRKRLGKFYYEQAKEAIDFDKDDFQTFATYCLIAYYAVSSLQIPLAASASSTACRIGAIMCGRLQEMELIEREMFKRLYQVCWQCHMNLAGYNPEDRIRKSIEIKRIVGKVMPFPDENLTIVLFYEAFFYWIDLASMVDNRVKLEDDSYKSFVTQMEQDLVAYFNKAPPRLKIPLHLAPDPPLQFSSRHALIHSYGYHAIWLRLHEPFLPMPGEPSNSSHTICTHTATVITKAYERIVKIHNPCHINFDILLRAASIHERNSNVECLEMTIWIIKNSTWRLTNPNILLVVKRLEDQVHKIFMNCIQ